MANNGLQRAIGNLEGQMKAMTQSMTDFTIEMSSMRTSFDNLEKGRLSKLEIEFANLIGKLTIIAIGVSILSSLLVGIVLKFIKI